MNRFVDDFLTKDNKLELMRVSKFIRPLSNGQMLGSWLSQNKKDPEKLKQKEREVKVCVLGSICMVNDIDEKTLREIIYEYKDAIGALDNEEGIS